jgi:hypothetical protein
MHTWAIWAAKEAAVASGLGAGLAPAIGVGPLDGFAVGVLASGACYLAVTFPRRARRRPADSAATAVVVARVPLPRLPADTLASGWERLVHTGDICAVPAARGGDTAPTAAVDTAPAAAVDATAEDCRKGARHEAEGTAAAPGEQRPAAHRAAQRAARRASQRRAAPRHAAPHAGFGSKVIGRIARPVGGGSSG